MSDKYKLFAPFVTLVAGAITLGVTIYKGYSFKDMLWTLLAVILIFYIISYLVQTRIHKFVEENERLRKEAEEQEGAVIEKDAPDAEGDEDGAADAENEAVSNNGEDTGMFRTRNNV